MSRVGVVIFAVVMLGAVGCDHATKQIATHTLAEAGVVSLAGDSIQLVLASNPGAFLSMGAELPETMRRLLFTVLAPLLLLVVSGFVLRGGPVSRTTLVALALVVGGGLGNWLDRLLHDGRVTDFVQIGFGPLRTGIFNLADVLIIGGVLLLFWSRTDPPAEPEPAR